MKLLINQLASAGLFNSVKGDITCCKIEPGSIEAGCQAEFENTSNASGLGHLANYTGLTCAMSRSSQKSCTSSFSTWEVSDSDHKIYFSKVTL